LIVENWNKWLFLIVENWNKWYFLWCENWNKWLFLIVENWNKWLDYNVNHAIVFSNTREVLEKQGVVYIPVYYVMFLDFACAGGEIVILPELEVV
jgi:hypothetical protein